ncbi:Uncharacterised protein [Salmonella enterica subsp. houtenae]|nr:Uncharacterised protein [Salmonella enterica subsp. houtenae]VUD26640.1 Uncharacterised protein [Salmonella sp. NCTC 7297]
MWLHILDSEQTELSGMQNSLEKCQNNTIQAGK